MSSDEELVDGRVEGLNLAEIVARHLFLEFREKGGHLRGGLELEDLEVVEVGLHLAVEVIDDSAVQADAVGSKEENGVAEFGGGVFLSELEDICDYFFEDSLLRVFALDE